MSADFRLAVTGTGGQVARALVERGKALGVEVVTVGRPVLDLLRPETVLPALAALQPDAIVSAAAYTGVDAAETDRAKALAVNEGGARAVALAARDLGVPLVHLSTDYVFAADARGPHGEAATATPAGIYGATKLAGERAVLAAHEADSAVLRTAWVHSPFGGNFVKTMLRLARDRDEVAVVSDQFGNPTSALDIADGIIAVARNLLADPDPRLRGLFHMTAQGDGSWADLASAVFDQSHEMGGPWAQVRSITTADYPTVARRPADSRLDCARIAAAHGITLPPWRSSLRPVVARLVARHHSLNQLAGASS
ncbi:dTDP-4-dehydrorhamnose reductase [Novosphingobium guangzhouense]|uniref:dTDP-4-dehydrorhamnose reductase n=1 Tax=Novosphingobium guangzhouense TaxID=1850347 RepID=A0A2K2FZW6_9SPHN|nr:dTDP-4-dehydrorhamnose reductase [Novosphingobium guangzhouense]PNU04323.1 dTDP-4-dehydrorhamnose reductase [Novosphingobium guangzhouense]